MSTTPSLTHPPPCACAVSAATSARTSSAEGGDEADVTSPERASTSGERMAGLRRACEVAFGGSYASAKAAVGASAAAAVGEGAASSGEDARKLMAVREALGAVTAADVGLTDPWAGEAAGESPASPLRDVAGGGGGFLMGLMHKLSGSAGGAEGGDTTKRRTALAPPPLPGRAAAPDSAASGAAPPITYLNVYECDAFSVGVFVLPPRARLPLHNHPDMVVFSKLLYGTQHSRSYDWDEPPAEGALHYAAAAPKGRRARLRAEKTLPAGGPPEVALPEEGNLHALTALTPCAMLDIIAPPYNTRVAGRDCTYYEELGAEEGDDGALRVVLREFEPPDDFYIRGGRYTGTPVR